MANWSSNNRACTTTWTTLRVLAQISESLPFKDAGTVKMKELLYWNQTASSEMRQIQAKTLAIMMDNVFRQIRGAKYEDGVSNETAVNDIVNILVNPDKTIADLAETNDKNYLFWKEKENA